MNAIKPLLTKCALFPIIALSLLCSCGTQPTATGPRAAGPHSRPTTKQFFRPSRPAIAIEEAQKQVILNAKTAYITVQQTYKNDSGEPLTYNFSLPFAERAATMLALAGISRSSSPQTADINVSIEVEGHELSGLYYFHGVGEGHKIVAGSVFKGEIAVKSGEMKPIRMPIKDGMGLPSFAHFGSGPQFQESFEQCNFTKVLLEFLWQTHGVSIFTSGATNSIANIRKLCAYALGDLAVPEGTEPLVKLIQDSNEAVGKAAWFALSESQDPRVPSLLIEALEKGDSKTKSRVASCFAMPMRRDAQAVDALLIQLQGNDSVVSCSCALALSSIRDARAIDALIEAMEKPKVRRAAHMALQSITGKDLGDDPFEWKKWRQK